MSFFLLGANERIGKTNKLMKGSVEKIAFFDASGLYALNRQQEVLNLILFIFSDLRYRSAILF